MSFLSKLFGSKPETPMHKPTHPDHLKVGDMLQMSDSFGLPEQLRGQLLAVKQVNTLEFEDEKIAEYLLEGARGEQLFLTVEKDDEEYAAFAIKARREQVADLFDLDMFATVFDEPGDAKLQRQKEPEGLTGWSCDSYYQTEAGEMGFFHRQDYRRSRPPSSGGEPFEYFSLSGHDDDYGIDIEVWKDGDTDVSLILYRPLTDIKEYLPGS